MTNELILDDKMIQHAWRAQLRHVIQLSIDALVADGTSDDGHDYLTGALDLASDLESMRYDSDIRRLDNLLRFDQDNIDLFSDDKLRTAPLDRDYGSDGVCPFLINLHAIINNIDELS